MDRCCVMYLRLTSVLEQLWCFSGKSITKTKKENKLVPIVLTSWLPSVSGQQSNRSSEVISKASYVSALVRSSSIGLKDIPNFQMLRLRHC